MSNKDIKNLQQAYSSILNEDLNSYANLAAHAGVLGSGALLVNYWDKIRKFFSPKEEQHIDQLMRGGNMKKIIDNFVVQKTPESRTALINALQQDHTLSNEMISKIVNKLSSITSERI